jgi:PAS domain S-box-containing protein
MKSDTFYNNNQFESIFENAKDGVQIADLSGNIVYFNRAAKQRLSIENIEGIQIKDIEPMFADPQIWQNHIENLRIKGQQIIRSVNINRKTNKSIPVEVTVELFKLGDQEYVFATTKDISDLTEKEQKLDVRERMLVAISESTTELLNNSNFFDAVYKVLEIIGKAVRVDRTYLFTFNYLADGEEVVSQRCEWNSGSAEPQIDNPDLQNTPTELFTDFMLQLRKRLPFQNIVAELPESSALKEILASQGIVSILILPVFKRGKLWGFIGYDECKYERYWDEIELSILQTLSNNITATLERIDYQNQIENLAEFPLENPAPIIRIDKSGNLLFQNQIGQIEQLTFNFLGKNEKYDLPSFLRFIAKKIQDSQHILFFEVETNNKKFYAITAKEIKAKDYINLYFSDISKLKETEQKLKAIKSVVNQIVNNMEDVIWSVSYPDYKPIFISPSTKEVYGIDSNEFYENTQIWRAPIIPEDEHIVAKIIAHIEQFGESDFTYRIKHKNGEIKWLRNKTKLMLDEDTKQPVRLDGYIIDITDQKRNEALKEKARELAEASNLAKEEFIANMSHEIRTPLNAILGFSRKLLLEIENQEQKKYLKYVLQSGEHLYSLIENILDFSKFSAGQFALSPSSMSIKDTIEETHSMLSIMAKEKGIYFNLAISNELDMFVKLDRKRFKQILINVLSNAIKFTDEGGVNLHAELSECKTALICKIEDTGIGMSKDFLNEIFKKFSQEDRQKERKQLGSGLGMAITKKIIDAMKGNIKIKSMPYRGTSVTLRIPFANENKIKKGSEKHNLKHYLNRLQNKHVLIAEDNDLNALVLTNHLQMFGMKHFRVGNGQEAIESIQKNNFDLVLMDVQMPIMDGIEATKIIRKDLQLEIPIIGLSANALSSTKNKCIIAGMNNFLTKPYEENRLFELLNQHLSMEIEENETSYDLSNLNFNLQQDKKHLEELTMLFIKLLPSRIKDMITACEKGDYTTIRKIAHKIKPNLLMFGVISNNTDIDFLNSFEEHNETHLSNLPAAINRIDELVKQVCQQMELDLTKKK